MQVSASAEWGKEGKVLETTTYPNVMDYPKL